MQKERASRIFARGSFNVRSVTLVIGLGKRPGRREGQLTQPFPSFKLKALSAGLAFHHTAVVAFWLAALRS